jgi:hypothetical protein
MTPRVAYAEILDGGTKKTAVAFWLRVLAPCGRVIPRHRRRREGPSPTGPTALTNARGTYTQVSRSWPFPPDARAAGEEGSSRFKRWSIRSLFVFK